MKSVLKKEEVAAVMSQLSSQNKKITLNALHAALGQRGSMTTLVRLKAEIEGESQTNADSEKGLKVFRELWALAVDEGRKQQEAAIHQLQEDCSALAAENERVDGLAVGLEQRVCELQKAKLAVETTLSDLKNGFEKELAQTKSALVHATDQARDALTQLSETQAAHAQEIRSLRERLDSTDQARHQLELELVRAKAMLEARISSKH